MDKAKEDKYKAALRTARDTIHALQDESAELKRKISTPQAPIAIIGMAGEFPADGTNTAAFEQMLLNGVCGTGAIPPERWNDALYYHATPGTAGKYYCRHAAFLARDPFAFDHEFFGLSRSEAEMMDPQQRILLKQSYHALEDAGIPPSSIQNSDTGVFTGISSFDHMMAFATPDIEHRSDPYTLTGASFNSACGRLSYYYDLHGPCAAFDTACSSALTAILAAVDALRKGHCPLALAGGVNLLTSPLSFVALSAIRALSADGLCRAFGKGATGFGRGEGCGIVVLKRLDAAMTDGNRIHAVILGGAAGHDGQSAGFTAPSGPAQQKVIRKALQDAGVTPAAIGYIETHGTGTDLGDPVEANALAETFAEHAPKLLIGSVKSNIGHLEAAAGIAALFKTIFAVRDDRIPPSLHADTLSPRIDWPAIAIEVCRKPTPWPNAYERRIAGVSSFGISGTLAHLIVAAPPETAASPNDTGLPQYSPPANGQPTEDCRPDLNVRHSCAEDSADNPDWNVLPLSAESEPALERLTEEYCELLSDPGADYAGICRAAAAQRDHYNHRIALCAANSAEAADKLTAFSEGKRSRDVAAGTAAKRVRIAFLYSGQGSQAPGMGKTLYRTQPPFRKVMDACNTIAKAHLDGDLLDVMFGNDADALNRTLYTQPAIYAMGAALTELWRSFGIRPSVVAGHSIGEYAAAYAAGVFSLETGMELVLERARLADRITTPGSMAAVLNNAENVRGFLAGTKADIAAINGSGNVAISGPANDVAAVCASLWKAEIAYREMPVSQAFHSSLIEPVLPEFKAFLESVEFNSPTLPFISSMSAQELNSATEWRTYWVEQMRQTVNFKDALTTIGPAGVYLEIGASPTLTSLCRAETSGGQWLFSQGPSTPAWRQISLALARLYTAGCKINFTENMPHLSATVDLPLYPFNESVIRPPVSIASASSPRLTNEFQEQPPSIKSGAPDATAAALMEMQLTAMHRLFARQREALAIAGREEHKKNAE